MNNHFPTCGTSPFLHLVNLNTIAILKDYDKVNGASALESLTSGQISLTFRDKEPR